MLVIRLQRQGKRNSPAYRVVVAEHSAPVQGRSLEILGHYIPTREPVVLECDTDRVSFWIERGAQPTDTIARLLSKHGMKGLEKFIVRYKKKRSKNAPPEEEVAAAAPAAPVAEAPAAETPAPVADAPADAPAEEKPAEVADKPQE